MGVLLMLFLILALQCLFPLFDGTAGRFVGLSVLNNVNQPEEFAVAVNSSDGGNVQQQRISLPPGAERALLLTELFGASISSATGWLTVDSSGTKCSSYLTIGNNDFLIGVDGANVTSTTLYLPHV